MPRLRWQCFGQCRILADIILMLPSKRRPMIPFKSGEYDTFSQEDKKLVCADMSWCRHLRGVYKYSDAAEVSLQGNLWRV
jgi:hypothetical protein